MDEEYLELLADYAARQSQEKRERKLREFKQQEVDAKKNAQTASRHVHALTSSARRSAAVHEVYKHALLLALSGRSAGALGAGAESEEN